MYIYVNEYFSASLASAFDLSWHFYLGPDIYQWHDDMSRCLFYIAWAFISGIMTCLDTLSILHGQSRGTIASAQAIAWNNCVSLWPYVSPDHSSWHFVNTAQTIAWNDRVITGNRMEQLLHLVTACESQCDHNGYFILFFISVQNGMTKIN